MFGIHTIFVCDVITSELDFLGNQGNEFQGPPHIKAPFKALKGTLAMFSWSYGLVKFAKDIFTAIDFRVTLFADLSSFTLLLSGSTGPPQGKILDLA